MKKLLVVVLAMVLVIGMATSAYAFTDTDNLTSVQQDSVYRLYALGVVNGYPDGSFGAANQISRAEFAKIVCIMSGLGDVTDVLKNTPSSFSDVAAGAWYTGYINVAAAQGFVHGYPDGTFKPNSSITMAEVVTMLMRAAGYNDNLPGPWPFDYIAEAGKQDVTKNVTFVSNVAAKRADVAVMTNNLLDVVLVDWTSDSSKFVKNADGTTVLDDSFGAAVYEDAIFTNDANTDDSVDGWAFSKFSKNEIQFSFYQYDDGRDKYDTTVTKAKMNADCYIAGGKNLADLGGMIADIIVNDDNEAIYVKLTSTVSYSDDVSGSISDEDLEVNDKSVEVNGDAPWLSDDFDATDSGYAKLFTNADGEIYAVADLKDAGQFGSQVIVLDSFDADEETLEGLDGTSVDLGDLDYAVIKDGKFVEASKLAQMDVVYVLEPATGNADYILLVEPMAEGDLEEGSGKVITVDGSDYSFGSAGFAAKYNLEGGLTGSYKALASITDLDDAFDESVSLALYRSHFDIAYLISDVNKAASHVYGVVTDIAVGGLFHKVQDVTILGQNGKEVTYDVDNTDNILTYDAGKASDIELGSYIEAKLDQDGAISGVDSIILAASVGSLADMTMDVSGSKIKINGTWYKVTKDTLFFETVTDGDGYLSANFDEANLIDVDDILNSDSVNADGAVIASHDGGTLERLYMVDSDSSSGNDNYSFVDKVYTNSSGSFVKMMDGTVAERKDDQVYDKNVFYSYHFVNGKMITSKIFAANDANTTLLDGSPYSDGYWVIANGTLAAEGTDYALGNIDVTVDAFKSGTLTLAGHYYTLTSDSQIFTIDSSKVVASGSNSDIKSGKSVLAISDEDGNLLYVFVLAGAIAAPIV